MSLKPSRRAFLAGLPAAILAACTGRRDHANEASVTTTSRAAQRSAPTTTSTTAASAAELGSFVRNGSRTGTAVALTFHGSGDPVLLSDLLAVAAKHHAPLTIFAVGQWLDANADIARRITGAGHELANHTYTHPVLSRLAPDKMLDEVSRCRDALTRHAGAPGKWFRPSGVEIPGPTIIAAAASAGYRTIVGYDVDPHDYQDPGAAAVRSRVAAGLQPGSIVSLHTGHRGTVDALSGVLDDISARGLRPVTVTELLLP